MYLEYMFHVDDTKLDLIKKRASYYNDMKIFEHSTVTDSYSTYNKIFITNSVVLSVHTSSEENLIHFNLFLKLLK